MMRALIFIIVSILAQQAYASGGTAIIPHWLSEGTVGTTNHTNLHLHTSNISGTTITVTVTLYDEAGNLISDTDDNPATGLVWGTNVASYTDNSTTYTARYDIPAHNTSRIIINTPNVSTLEFGYGKIEWSASNNKLGVAMVAHCWLYRHFSGAVGYLDVTVNNGLPF